MARTCRQRLRLMLLRALARWPRSTTPALSSVGAGKTRSARISRILVIRPDHLGDVLFTTPALRTLRGLCPDAYITALVGPWGAPVLFNNPHIDEIVCLPFPGFTKQRKPSIWQPYGLLRNWARQLRGQYDLAIILRFDHWWGALLAYLAGVPQRLGYAVPEVTPFLSDAMLYVPGRHEVEQNLRLLDLVPTDRRSATYKPPPASPIHDPLEFRLSEQAVTWARDLTLGAPMVAIHPGAGAAVKLWHAADWAVVADALADETGGQIALTGSESENRLCERIAGCMGIEAQVLAGETTLEQLAALFGQCRLVLGLDSGPLHLAVAVGTPTVQLYGPVDAAAFGPWGPANRHRVLVSDWPCIPCNRLDYKPGELVYHPCVREIKVQHVLAEAREILSD
jgi:lipopolysaccharide heptosyltransferase II